MSEQKLSHTLIIIIIFVNLVLLSCEKIPDDNTIRDKRQFLGGSFGAISVPFFNYVWGNHHGGWNGPWNYGWGQPSFRPPFGIRRRFWRRRWENWNGFHEAFGGHSSFGGPWFA